MDWFWLGEPLVRADARASNWPRTAAALVCATLALLEFGAGDGRAIWPPMASPMRRRWRRASPMASRATIAFVDGNKRTALCGRARCSSSVNGFRADDRAMPTCVLTISGAGGWGGLTEAALADWFRANAVKV